VSLQLRAAGGNRYNPLFLTFYSFSTSPPVSPSPYEVSKERGNNKKEGYQPPLAAHFPSKSLSISLCERETKYCARYIVPLYKGGIRGIFKGRPGWE